MNMKALKTLEYTKIIELLTAKAISKMGKEKCQGLLPTSDLSLASRALGETEQALEILLKQSSLPLGGITDISFSIKRAVNSGILNIEELFGVGEFLYVCKKVQNYAKLTANRPQLPIIDAFFDEIAQIPGLERLIQKTIKNQQEIFDDATDKLLGIRRGIKTASDKVNSALNAVIQSNAYKNMLQDAVITIRSGRYCIPIKREYQNSFPGIVHDMSSSGATLFIEPASVVNLNNRIRELGVEEKDEIEQILRSLSQQVANHNHELTQNFEILIQLDFIFAKGELALEMNGTKPELNENGIIDVKKARHPLLDSKAVVPIDITLGSGYKCLLITGPNTGGKTVALKTLGLFSLMSAAGLFIPASFGAKIAIFDEVFSDIGDEQSIEQSLSTFSSHMVNIVSILSQITPNSLVLLDELGAGTDPTEGAALAIAIIQNILDWGAVSAITTHYSELKLFAIEHKNIMNAAVEFDINSLRPTYKLITGALGKSNAFAISQRLGLSENIIDMARGILSKENIKFEDIIADLETAKKTAEIEEERALRYRIESENAKKEIERQKEKILKNRDKEIERAKNEARDIISKAKKEADEIIKNMRQTASTAQLEAGRASLNEKLTELGSEGIKPLKKAERKLLNRPIEQGDAVFMHSLGLNGTVKSINKAAQTAVVLSGIMEVKAELADLSAIEAEAEKSEAKRPSKNQQNSVKIEKATNISSRLDLRGMLVLEALEELEKYIDDAYLASAGKIEIIHGKGTGALRDAVQKALKRHPYIKTYRLGEFGEGDSGVTIAEVK